MDKPLIIAVPKKDVLFDASGKVVVAFTVHNPREQAARVRPRLVPVGSANEWGEIVGDPEREIAPGATEPFALQIAVPPADWSPSRQYRYALRTVKIYYTVYQQWLYVC